jgi:heptosyltransferase-2
MGLQETRTDCRHFRGDVPCEFRRTCPGCPHFQPTGERILIVKLGALGDVLRTTPILRRIRGEFPSAHISWVTAQESLPLLAENPLADRCLSWGLETVVRLDAEAFHRVICLDKAPEAAALAVRVQASERVGFGLDQRGLLVPLNAESQYAYRLGVDDELKFRMNRKSYQEITFEQLGWAFQGEEYALFLTEHERIWARARMRELGQDAHAPVGMAIGAGRAFANKTWPPHRWAGLAQRVMETLGKEVLLLVGPGERDLGEEVRRRMKGAGAPTSGADHGVREFAALLERCAAVVSGDTLAMHLAIAVKTRVVALFGPTCAQEVELYGHGLKVVSPKGCAPCYRRECEVSPTCLEEISDEDVIGALRSILNL